ncbi:MAG: nucleotide exchange factor GrpE [Magnetococcales bacterium]|nr:nucleotide exchange factor GrpE [Magnetococcales bacterium]
MEQHKESSAKASSVATVEGAQEDALAAEEALSVLLESTADSGDGEKSVEAESAPEERIKSLEQELVREQERSEARRKDHLTALAEMDNLRKRTEREMEKARKFALAGFARDLLTLADNVERALTAIRANLSDAGENPSLWQSLVQGVELIEKDLAGTFARHGIEKIEALKKPFDPNLHQAITQVDDAEAESGSVVQELQTGYLLNGRLLRPTLVNIAK